MYVFTAGAGRDVAERDPGRQAGLADVGPVHVGACLYIRFHKSVLNLHTITLT